MSPAQRAIFGRYALNSFQAGNQTRHVRRDQSFYEVSSSGAYGPMN